MIVILTKDYRCAPEGHTIISFKKGDEVTGRVAEFALSDKAGKLKPKKLPRPKVTKPDSPEHEA